MINKLITLWKFSRPHTLVGSFLSVLSLLFLAAEGRAVSVGLFPDVFLTLMAALSCNIFITGLNQVCDLPLDRINKPYLPLPAGLLKLKNARATVVVCLALALICALFEGVYFTVLISSIATIGVLYSMPPFQLKRKHVLAAAAILVVRGLLVNLGFFVHYRMLLGLSVEWTAGVWVLTVFVILFSVGIAWFKDIPDTGGDAQFDISTLALSVGRKRALQLGAAMVLSAYLLVLVSAIAGLLPEETYFILSHSLLLLAFVWMLRRVDIESQASIRIFYISFWILFFLEYILFPLAYYLG